MSLLQYGWSNIPIEDEMLLSRCCVERLGVVFAEAEVCSVTWVPIATNRLASFRGTQIIWSVLSTVARIE
jgi:hypothetical protein